ncbi:hypothetical protein L4C54_15585 [Vibrio lamellibrachiae]|uniref:hypothetical protein n=1 Tax=Vibrio lamellibrachiae TaxID=2910253 RepID=UPI003D0E72BE
MKKRILPIPLILLIPIVLLVAVVIAGIYRFSLNDEDILNKFPQHAPLNPIVGQLFNIDSSNPLTIDVPENDAFAFISFVDEKRALAVGQYDSGSERGGVSIDTNLITPMEIDNETVFVSSLAVSNQGTGVFYYLALYRYDAMRDRMILADYEFLGDRIRIDILAINEQTVESPISEEPAVNEDSASREDKSNTDGDISDDMSSAEKQISITFRTRNVGEAMAKPATVEQTQLFRVSEKFIIEQVLPQGSDAS